MAIGAIIENMSGRKISFVILLLLSLQVFCFFLGAFISPKPNSSDLYLATKCIDPTAGADKQTWFYPRGVGRCKSIDDFTEEEVLKLGLTADHVVFSFQLPHAKEKIPLDFSRWQQTLMGILTLDIEYEDGVERDPRVLLMMNARLGYKDKGQDHWKEYASSFVTRNLDCDIEESLKMEGHYYNCSILPLFDLGSLHHDYYLLNVRLPSIFDNEGQVIDINEKLGKLVDVWLVAIHQNGGFTKVWVTLKTAFFPLIILEIVWFWRRIQMLTRQPTLLEKMLLALGCSLSLLNIPLEYLTLSFDIPWLTLVNDIKQGIFYATLMIFWMIFSGEHLLNDISSGIAERNGLIVYWQKLAIVLFGCLCLFIFDICEKGVQLQNPFYSIWVTDMGTNLALGFIILAGLSAGTYFLFLCYLIYNVFKTISEKQAAISAMTQMRRLHYQGIIWRFRFLMLATVITAMMTVIGFIIGQVSEVQYKWDDDISLEYTSGFMTGVYGMWNIYVFGLLFLYAPSHKRWANESSEEHDPVSTGDEIEFTVQSGQISRSSAVGVIEPSELSSLTNFIRHQATD